jgi:hypothetical protein
MFPVATASLWSNNVRLSQSDADWIITLFINDLYLNDNVGLFIGIQIHENLLDRFLFCVNIDATLLEEN